MRLLLDAGNSRVKWRLDAGGTVAARGAWRWGAAPDLPADAAMRPSEVCAVCVAGAGRRQELAALISAQYARNTGFASSQRQAFGVRNSYADVSRMGADRWLAMVAAFDAARGAVGIIDAGTAITVDGVATDGRHLGGYIMPGLTMLRDALLRGTGEIRVDHASQALDPGEDTETAVGHGCLLMAAAAIDAAAARLCSGPLLLCGGDAGLLQPLLSVATEQRPDLVLDGLALVAAGSLQGGDV